MKIPKVHLYKTLIAIVAVLGLIDSLYLSYARATHSSLACSVLDGCNVVAASPQAVLFGIFPLAYIGVLFYLGSLILLFLHKRETLYGYSVAKLFMYYTIAGVASSAYFIYLQAFVIRAFCIYCIASAISSVILALLALLLLRATLINIKTAPEAHEYDDTANTDQETAKGHI